MVNLQSPSVFHSLIDRSREPETICRLSAEKETERTSLVWPTNRRVVTPVANSQRRRVLSHDAESAYAPSDEMTYKNKNKKIINPAFHILEQGGGRYIRNLKQCESGRGAIVWGIRSFARRESGSR